MTNVTYEEISQDEAWAIFDEAAVAALGISGSELASRWDRGEFATDDSIDLMEVILLRPSGR